eukprot:gb/GEZN01008719.1/.p1 GENE.gb/GEZN01008719.1/~~gb/GEZN01008719.1/.p1  ORF type:complete len:382 (-),score=68.37 gb/GEZN01008719.1/:146-1291(-)
MSAMDYVSMEESAEVSLGSAKIIKTALGTAGLALVTMAAWAANTLHFSSSADSDRQGTAFVPKEGVEQVVLRGGGGVQFLPPASVSGGSCVFLYSPPSSDLIDGTSSDQEAWIYGASRQEGQVAVPSGEANDVVKGRLLCWPVALFKGKLGVLDTQQGYDPFKPNQAFVRRGVVSAVKADGSAEKAYWYFKNRAQIGQTTKQSGLCSARGAPLNFYSINDVVMGGRSSSTIEPTPSGGLLFEGVVSTVGGGFTSFRADLPDRVPSDVKAVAVTTKGGDGREYKINFQYNGTFQFPITYEGKFRPTADGSTLRSCFSLSRDLKPVYMARPLWVKDPLSPPQVLTVGLLLNHVSGANRQKFGDGEFPFSLELERLEWLTQDCS